MKRKKDEASVEKASRGKALRQRSQASLLHVTEKQVQEFNQFQKEKNCEPGYGVTSPSQP